MKHLVKIRKRRLPGSILCWILIAVFVFLISFPFLYILSTALKSDQDLATSVGRILPEFFEWSNFAKAWELLDFPINFLNSFVVSSAVTLLTILLCSLAAYVFTRLEFKGRNIIFVLYLSTMMIPITVRLIPSYLLCRELNLLDTMEDNIKEDRTAEDLLFQVMLDLGVPLSSKIEETIIADKKVFDVADGFLIACFDEDVNEETIKAIAQKEPYYFVMRDSSLANDSVSTNFEQIFATYSPETVRKVL